LPGQGIEGIEQNSTEKETQFMGLNRHGMSDLVSSAFEKIVWILYSKSAAIAMVAPHESSYFIECFNSASDAGAAIDHYIKNHGMVIDDFAPMAVSFDVAREFAKKNNCWGLALVDEKGGLVDKHWTR
jgi:hypothetical protein